MGGGDRTQYQLGELTESIKSVHSKLDVFIEALKEHKIEDDALHAEHEKRMDEFEKKEIRLTAKMGVWIGLVSVVSGLVGSFAMNYVLGLLLKRTT